ncbi:MAG: ABC transporter permease [Clostridiales bacterium]|nr:ABC transporter permease [Clostridiales bacterium]
MALPYAVLLVVFVVVPLFIVLCYAFTASDGGFSFDGFTSVFTRNRMAILWESLKFSFFTTVICFAVAYPIAFILSNKKFNRSGVLILLFVLPMWINFLLRMLAVKTVFDFFGVGLGYIPALVGSAYDFLPFMILPIYTTLCNIDKSLTEASADLGAGSVRTFFRVTLPLSVPGVLSGSIMVFMPSLSSFAVPQLLGLNLRLFGEMIDNQFIGSAQNYNIGSAMSFVMLALVGLSMFIANRVSKKQGGIAEAKGGLW